MTAHSPLPLWPGGAPGALGNSAQDIPTLTPYIATSDTATAAMLICPGGGYGHLAPHEGEDYALFLRDRGISCFVLHYRLGTNGYRHPAMHQDVSRAMRLIRANATTWNIDPQRVGVMGSSAGGHLAATLLTGFDAGNSGAADPVERHSSRPTLGVLCYSVISMGAIGHAGSRQNLLGDNPSAELITQLSAELNVSANTPPCFIWHTGEDASVKMENSLEFASALRRSGVPFDLHIYQNGAHGIGLADVSPFANPHPWARDLEFWLREQNFTV